MRFVEAECVLETLVSNGYATRTAVDEVYRLVKDYPDSTSVETLRHIIAHRAGGRSASYHATFYVKNRIPWLRVNETFAREWYILCGLPKDFFQTCNSPESID